MFFVHRLPRRFAGTALTALAAFALSVGVAAPEAGAQISGSLAGNFVGADEIADGITDGTSNTAIFGAFIRFEDPGRVVISADVAAGDDTRITHIIAVLIALLAPGGSSFIDYGDDACLRADGGAPDPTHLRACSLVGRAFRDLLRERRAAVSPGAVMLQGPRGIAIWDPAKLGRGAP